MRLHHLTLQAIGPFAERFDINFDELSAYGLFLLEGPTGAGKSTIIDAIVFALYGTTAGMHSSDQRLHSAHADRSVEPLVELVFSTSAGVFKVRRTPRYERPKQRGSGMTMNNATAKLWRLPATGALGETSTASPITSGEPLASAIQEVSSEVRRLVVLDSQQFTQTVVLPQGQFATFLRAKPEERREVLQDIFGTKVYEQLQVELATLARHTRNELDEARRHVAQQVSAFIQAAGVADDEREALEQAAEGLDAEALRTATAQQQSISAEEYDDAKVAEQRAGAAEAAAATALTSAQRLAERLQRRTELLEEHHELTAKKQHISDLARRHRDAEAARRLTAQLSALEEADVARSQAAENVAQTEDRVREAEQLDLLGLGVEQLRTVASELTELSGALQSLRELEEGLNQRNTALTEQRSALVDEQQDLERRRNALGQRPVEHDRLNSRLTDARQRAAAIDAARLHTQHCQRVQDAASEAQRYESALATAEAELLEAAAAAKQAQQTEAASRAQWVAGMAGHLATRLEPGKPCPVCGSQQHPEKAIMEPTDTTAEDVDEAASRRLEADQHLTDTRLELDRYHERLTAERTAAEGKDVEAAQAALDDARQQEQHATDAEAEAADLQARLEGFNAETERLRHGLQAAEKDAERRETMALQAAEQLATDTKRVTSAAGHEGTVVARIAALQERASLATALAQGRVEHHRRSEDHAAATSNLATALQQEGFSDADEARAAAVEATQREAMAAEIAAYERDVHRVAAALSEPEISGLDGSEDPGVDQRRREHDAAHESLLAATRQAQEARSRTQRCKETARDVEAALHHSAAENVRAQPLLRMARLATAGDGNELATTLATYVLLRRFEDVVAAANDRLRFMSQGRYELRRIDELEGGQRARKAGLGLEVCDNHTEQPRDPHTLSGGETFYVSLCLALGLSDVVAGEAGGVSLDTLFIDEGFGSLDTETLDGVLAELDRLQAGGRSVGIVSHVAELKNRIYDRIEVWRSPQGPSRLRVLAGGS